MGESAVCGQIPADGEMDIDCSLRTELKRDSELLIDNVESDSFANKTRADCAVCEQIQADGEVDIECSTRSELKRDRELLTDNVESDSFPNKKQAKEEALNDDIKSEVSNPVVSPKDFTSSSQDITSQETKIVRIDRAGSIEVPSTSSGNLSSEETLSDGEHTESSHMETSGKDTNFGDVSKSHVVLEIPKHVSSSSGIRKITFKFSKRKEDYVAPAAEPVAYEEGNHYSVYDDLYTYQKGSAEGSNRNSCTRNMEIKMSKKVVPNEYPTNVKKLLSTGILDGARVKYISTTREVNFCLGDVVCYLLVMYTFIGYGLCHLLVYYFSFWF